MDPVDPGSELLLLEKRRHNQLDVDHALQP